MLSPRRVPLTAEQQRLVVDLLADLLLDAAAKRRAVRSPGVIDGGCDGVIGGAIPSVEERGDAREAA